MFDGAHEPESAAAGGGGGGGGAGGGGGGGGGVTPPPHGGRWASLLGWEAAGLAEAGWCVGGVAGPRKLGKAFESELVRGAPRAVALARAMPWLLRRQYRRYLPPVPRTPLRGGARRGGAGAGGHAPANGGSASLAAPEAREREQLARAEALRQAGACASPSPPAAGGCSPWFTLVHLARGARQATSPPPPSVCHRLWHRPAADACVALWEWCDDDHQIDLIIHVRRGGGQRESGLRDGAAVRLGGAEPVPHPDQRLGQPLRDLVVRGPLRRCRSRGILAEIFLCAACSCHEILRSATARVSRLGEAAHAEADARRLIELAPTEAIGWERLGQALTEGGRHEAAHEALQAGASALSQLLAGREEEEARGVGVRRLCAQAQAAAARAQQAVEEAQAAVGRQAEAARKAAHRAEAAQQEREAARAAAAAAAAAAPSTPAACARSREEHERARKASSGGAEAAAMRQRAVAEARAVRQEVGDHCCDCRGCGGCQSVLQRTRSHSLG
jgi:hypothetical protein